MELALTMLNQVNHSKDHNQATQAALIHHHLHHQEHFHGEVLTALLGFQVGLVITHLVAQASMAEADVEDVTAAVIIQATDLDLALHRPVARNMKVRGQKGHQGHQVVVVDHAAMADEEDMSILKVRRDTGMKDLEVVEALEHEEEEDTEVDGDITVAGDLLHLVVQEEWVGLT